MCNTYSFPPQQLLHEGATELRSTFIDCRVICSCFLKVIAVM